MTQVGADGHESEQGDENKEDLRDIDGTVLPLIDAHPGNPPQLRGAARAHARALIGLLHLHMFAVENCFSK